MQDVRRRINDERRSTIDPISVQNGHISSKFILIFLFLPLSPRSFSENYTVVCTNMILNLCRNLVISSHQNPWQGTYLDCSKCIHWIFELPSYSWATKKLHMRS
jgi:hypothetical protein